MKLNINILLEVINDNKQIEPNEIANDETLAEQYFAKASYQEFSHEVYMFDFIPHDAQKKLANNTFKESLAQQFGIDNKYQYMKLLMKQLKDLIDLQDHKTLKKNDKAITKIINKLNQIKDLELNKLYDTHAKTNSPLTYEEISDLLK